MSTGTRTRRAKRARASDLGAFVAELDGIEEGRKAFRRTWSGGITSVDLSMYVPTPFSTHRDADALESSNWSVIERKMRAADSFDAVSEHPGVLFDTEGSALCGWVENIYVRRDDIAALRMARSLVGALSDYPVLDEKDYSEREWAENHPALGECYAEDCSCPTFKHNRLNEETEDAGCRDWLSNADTDYGEGGWRAFDSSDVDAITTDDRPEGDIYSVHNAHRGGWTSWQWYCGADGCGCWVDANEADLRVIRRHRLYSDLPPAPTVSLIKEFRLF